MSSAFDTCSYLVTTNGRDEGISDTSDLEGNGYLVTVSQLGDCSCWLGELARQCCQDPDGVVAPALAVSKLGWHVLLAPGGLGTLLCPWRRRACLDGANRCSNYALIIYLWIHFSRLAISCYFWFKLVVVPPRHFQHEQHITKISIPCEFEQHPSQLLMLQTPVVMSRRTHSPPVC